jgi:hypothetical protein
MQSCALAWFIVNDIVKARIYRLLRSRGEVLA